MTYDLEKYRTKREKVLGVKKRGLSFQLLSALFASVIIILSGVMFVPDFLSYIRERNLDDAIYKLKNSQVWEKSIVESVKLERGVSDITISDHGRRLILTFNRETYSIEQFEALVKRKGVNPVLLNLTTHSGRKSILKEEKEFEAL